MPKLSAQNAKKVAETETGGRSFEPLPEGKYRVRLTEVESAMTRGDNGATKKPKWVWKFEVVAPAEHEGRWLFEHAVIGDSTLWKLAQIFEAFGVPTDTDTDDLIGETIDVMVGQEIAQRGKLAGKTVNRITDYIPAAEPGPASEGAKAPAGGENIPF